MVYLLITAYFPFKYAGLFLIHCMLGFEMEKIVGNDATWKYKIHDFYTV